ncbi:MAG: response regulator [Desulfobacterota bacterium]|nr:response regulator [Thermodesulfobacteriota bacterium]
MDDKVFVLCVDDERNVLRSLERLCMDEPYTLLTADTSAAGIAILEQQFCPVVISDYRMLDMNGVAFLREVRKRWPDTVRIVLSGYADAATIVSAINEGEIYKFIPKPWNDDELKVAILNAIEKYRLQQENKRLTAELLAKNAELEHLTHNLEKIIDEKTADLQIQNRSLQLAQTILNILPLAVIGIDNEGMIVQLNRAACNVLSEKGLVIGESAHNVLPGAILHAAQTAQKQGCPIPYTADGRQGMVFSVPLYDGTACTGRVIIIQESIPSVTVAQP